MPAEDWRQDVKPEEHVTLLQLPMSTLKRIKLDIRAFRLDICVHRLDIGADRVDIQIWKAV